MRDVKPARAKAAPIDQTPYHPCWYPVSLASEIAPGQVTGIDFLGGRAVVYRTEGGTARVRSAYCRHLGADLAIGDVVGEELRCPFHQWRYGEDGRCTATAVGDPAPRAARLFPFPTKESLGLIWAFNGEEPTYEVPGFRVGEDALVVDAFRNPIPMHVALPVVFLNSFDIQHFRVVHKLDIEASPADMRREGSLLHYRAHVRVEEFGTVLQERTLWGTNTVTIENVRDGRPLFLLHALCPIGPDQTLGFLVNATPRGNDANAIASLLEDARAYSLRLVGEDAPIFDTMRFKADCLTRSDLLLRYGMDYIASFPNATPAAAFIT